MDREKVSAQVKAFKHYMNQNPQLLKEYRRSGRHLQYYFNQWKSQNQNKQETQMNQSYENKTGNNQGILRQFFQMIESIDVEKVQKQTDQINHVITDIKKLVDEYQKNKADQHKKQPFHPFHWYRD